MLINSQLYILVLFYFYSHLKPYSFKKGQTIISIGDKVDCEYFVLNGCLKTFYVNDDQKMFMYPSWYNIVPKQLIAACLGVLRETLSRLF